MDVPKQFKYSKDHEWALVEEDTVTVGITDYAVQELGDIVFVELPDVGDQLNQEQAFGTIESVKAVSELFAPISGEIIEVNEDLLESPETANEDPYGEAWMVKLQLSDPAELVELMDADAYENYLSEIAK